MNYIKTWSNNILKIDSIYKMNVSNSFEIPEIKNITLNICSRSIIEDPKTVLYSITALKLITNQKPITCKAKKSVAVFKLRKGVLVGAKVTLRKKEVYNFLTLFILLILPNMKEFKPCKVNNSASLSIGIKDLLVFPQLSNYYDKFPKNISGIININLSKKNPNLSNILLTGYQIPMSTK
jgi:large subunit ribosomal protein L5